MSPLLWRASSPRPKASSDQKGQEAQNGARFWLILGGLGLALGVRLLWLELYQNFLGVDAIRYLWISQHVSRGEWHLLPQLYTSPLLPMIVGLLARITDDHLLAGRIISILSNSLTVVLAMLLVSRLFPQRPALAWLTGLGLAVNHVWARMAPFVLTDNLFYLTLMSLLWLMALLLEQVTWRRSLAFGLVWGLLFLSRDIGLYCGAAVFGCLVIALVLKQLWQRGTIEEILRLAMGSLSVLALVLLTWGVFYHQAFGIVSLGEGHRFYISYTQKFDREARHPFYENGTMSFFHLRPFEVMEYTRFPSPGDERYPPSAVLTLFSQPIVTLQIFWDNLWWSIRELQRTPLVGWLILFFIAPLGILTGRLKLPTSLYWVFLASLGMLGLHFLGPVREARLIGWFFPWSYLGLAGFTLWLVEMIQARPWGRVTKSTLTFLIGGLFLFHILYPQYFREVPRRWPIRQAPHVHTLASAKILGHSGPGAVIASREPEVVFRSQGYWIGLPYGKAEEVVAWLYLGGANYLFMHDAFPIPEEEKIFWANVRELAEKFPELEIVADFTLAETPAYGNNGRLLRVKPQPDKFSRYQAQFPWAGTHPRTTGAYAPEAAPTPAAEKKIMEN